MKRTIVVLLGVSLLVLGVAGMALAQAAPLLGAPNLTDEGYPADYNSPMNTGKAGWTSIQSSMGTASAWFPNAKAEGFGVDYDSPLDTSKPGWMTSQPATEPPAASAWAPSARDEGYPADYYRAMDTSKPGWIR